MQKKNISLLSMILLFTMCGAPSEKEMFDSALQNIKDGKYLDASTTLTKVLSDFPQGEYKFDANYELAKLYHGVALKTISKKESIQKAVEYYAKAFKADSTNAEAHKALFMSAFLKANELKDLEGAKDTYRKFIELFPESELAVSAKAEIDNLGKSPEEILAGKVETSQ